MAASFPSLDQFFPKLTPPPVKPVAAGPMGPPEPGYNDLTPAQQAWVDKQTELAQNPRSALGEIGTGGLRGLVGTLPGMAGQALQATGKEGDLLYGIGKKISDNADMRSSGLAADINPDAHGMVVDALSQGAEMLAPSLAGLATLPVASALGLPAAGGLALSGLASAGLFGASQFTQTYDKAVKQGIPEDEAKAAAYKTAAYESLGEAVATPVLGKLLTGARMFPRVLGKKYTTDMAIQRMQNPEFMKAFARDMGETMFVETATEMGQNAGEAAVEKNAGISSATPWDAATQAIGPTIAMTALLGPFAALGLRSRVKRNQQLANIVSSPDSTLNQTNSAMRELAPQLEPLVGREALNDFRTQALTQALAKEMDPNHGEAEASLVNRNQSPMQMADDGTRTPNFDRQVPAILGTPQDTPDEAAARYRTQAEAQAAWSDVAGKPTQAAPTQSSLAVVPDAVAAATPPSPDVVAPQTVLPTQVLASMQAKAVEADLHKPMTGQWGAKMNQILAASAQEPTWDSQLEYLRKARDAKAPKKGAEASNTFEALSALVTNVEKYHGATESVLKDAGQGNAQAGRQEQGQEALLKGEQNASITPSGEPAAPAVAIATTPAAAPTKAAAVSNAAQRKAAAVSAVAPATQVAPVNAAPVVEAAPTPPPVSASPSVAAPNVVDIAGKRLSKAEEAAYVKATLAPLLVEARDMMARGVMTSAELRGAMKQKSQRAVVAEVERVVASHRGEGVAANDAKAEPITLDPDEARNRASNVVDSIKRVAKQDKVKQARAAKAAAAKVAEVVAPAPAPAVVAATVAPIADTKQARVKRARTNKAAETKVAATTAPVTQTVVTSTGQEVTTHNPRAVLPDGTIKYGAVSREPIKGDITYGTKQQAAKDESTAQTADRMYSTMYGIRKAPMTANELAAEKRRKEVVPAGDRRKVSEEKMYQFEFYNYNPDIGRDAGVNRLWIDSYEQAAKYSTEVKADGSLTPRAKNAKAALDWLDLYEGADIKDRAVLRSLKGADALSERVRPLIEAAKRRLAEALQDQLKAWQEERRFNVAAGMSFMKANDILDSMMEIALSEAEKNDPKLQALHAAAANYAVNEAFTKAADTGKFDTLLESIQNEGPSDWTRYLAQWLRSLNLNTNVKTSALLPVGTSGQRVYGRYNHQSNTMTLYTGGANAHTVLHEGAHAATVGKILQGLRAMKLPSSMHTAEDKIALAAVEELQSFMAEMQKLDGGNQYAFRNEAEFVAEALSNEKFQSWLKGHTFYGQMTMWEKFVNMIAGIFGFEPYKGINALTKALDISSDFMTGSHFGAEQGKTFNHSATAAAEEADTIGTTFVQRAMAYLGKKILSDRVRGELWHFSSTYNIAEWVDKMPALKALAPGLRDLMRVDELRVVMRMEKQAESGVITKPLRFALAKLSYSDAKAMKQRLMGFAGDMTQLGIDLNKNYEQNLAANPLIDPSQREYINRRYGEYKQLKVQFKKPFEESFRVLRKGYIQSSINILREVLQIHAGDSPQLQPLIDRLNIRAEALGANKVNPRPDFYFDSYSADADKLMRKTLEEAAKIQTQDGHLSADLHDVAKFYSAAVEKPYMHLGRSGEYFLQFDSAKSPQAWEAIRAAFEPLGKVVGPITANGRVFMRFETQDERNIARKAVDALGANVVPNSVLNGSIYDSESLQNMQGVPRFVRMLSRKVDIDFEGDNKKEMRLYLRRALLDAYSDTSPQKALVQRKTGGVAGYDADFLRSFAKRAEGQAAMISNGYTMPMYDKAFDAMKEVTKNMKSGNADAQDQASLVLGEMGRRFANSMSPVESPIIDGAKAFGFSYFLALSPAFWLTNMVQPYHLTLPYIGGRYGFASTTKEMKASTAKGFTLIKAAVEAGWTEGMQLGGKEGALKGILDLNLPLEKTGLRPDEAAFVRELILSGQLDTTQSHEQGRIASGESERLTSVTKLLSMGSHYTEVLNRLTAGLTAYNMAARSKNENLSKEAKLIHDTSYGIDTVRATQFDYSDHNTARALGRHGFAGKVTPLIASFQQYSFQTMELLIRLAADSMSGTAEEKSAARKGLAGVMATTSILAGSLGLPMANAIAAVVDRLLGDGDDPSDVKAAYREWLAGVFGKDVAEAIARGVPRAVLGFDTSTRMGLADVLPGTRFLADRRDLQSKMDSGAFNLMGPAVSAGTSVVSGVGKMMDGQMMNGLIDVLPLALKGPVKAVKMEDTGYTTSTGNAIPIEVTPWAAVSQTLGFTPSVKAEQSEVNFSFKQRDGLLKQRKTLLSNKLYNTLEQGEDATAIMQDVMNFNTTNPQYRIDVGGGMAARAKARAVGALSEAGIDTLPRYLPLLDRYSYANVK